jgi:phosphatidylglycerophosphate synthase
MPGEATVPSFDKYITYPLTKLVAPYVHKLGITPNGVTLTNAVFRLFIVCYLIRYDYLSFAMLVITQFLDDLDGTIARMFNQQSEFGAELDMITDLMFWTALVVIAFTRCKNFWVRFVLVVYSVIGLLAAAWCKVDNWCDIATAIDSNIIPTSLVYYMMYLRCHK